jgi:hypothetical protein
MIDEKSFKKISHLIRSEGEHNSRLMYKFPTALEGEVMKILDDNGIRYKFQQLFYRFVRGYRQYVEAYYIANFWIPKKKLILEIQPARRKIEVDSEKLRTFSYEGISPRAQVLKITKEDLECPTFAQELLALIK